MEKQNKIDKNSIRLDNCSLSCGRYIITPTVLLDTQTNLMWDIPAPQNTLTFAGALTEYIDRLNDNQFGDSSKWRLPSLRELLTLVEYESCAPAVIRPLQDWVCSTHYWTKTCYMPDPDQLTWCVNFRDGSIRGCHRDFPRYAIGVAPLSVP